MALRVRGETVDEITGAVTAMRAKMLRVKAPAMPSMWVAPAATLRLGQCFDLRRPSCCGCRRAGAKHGTARCRPSARRVLSSLGVRIDITPEHVGPLHRRGRNRLMFAPSHHPAMKNVGPTRVELATRTISIWLARLSNPSGVNAKWSAYFSRQWVQPLGAGAEEPRAESVWVVHGSDGLDEITLTGPTFVAALRERQISAPLR